MSPPPSDKPPPALPSTTTTLWSELRAILDLLLDFSFQRFVTPRLIRVLYALSLLAALMAAVTWMFKGFREGRWVEGLFNFVTGPLAFLLYVLIARVVMEVILVLFQIAERLKDK